MQTDMEKNAAGEFIRGCVLFHIELKRKYTILYLFKKRWGVLISTVTDGSYV